MSTGEKLVLAITEPLINDIAQKAIDRVMNSIEGCITEAVQYDLIPRDVAKIITEIIMGEDEDKSLTKIEIDLLQIRGSLMKMVRQRVYESLPDHIEQQKWGLFENESE